MTRKLVAILLVAMFALSACEQAIDSGQVVDKQFIPEHQETYTTWTYCGNGCMMPIEETTTVPDSWQILVEKNKKHGWIGIPHFSYSRILIGSYYDPKGPLNGAIKPFVCSGYDYEMKEMKCHQT